MTMPIEKEPRRKGGHGALAKPPAPKFKLNPPTLKLRRASRNTIAMRPYNHKEMTKSEMYADLKKAVENTSSPRRSRTGDTE